MRAYRLNTGWVLLILYALLLLLGVSALTSCGVRNVNVNKESSKNVNENKESSKGNTSKTSSSSDESTVKEQAAVVNENTETSTTTKYDKETGKPTESTTTTKQSKTTDNSTKDSKSLKTKINRVDSTFNNHHYKLITITEHKKVKDTDADNSFVTNVGGVYMVGFIALLVVAAVFLYFYLNKRR